MSSQGSNSRVVKGSSGRQINCKCCTDSIPELNSPKRVQASLQHYQLRLLEFAAMQSGSFGSVTSVASLNFCMT